MNDIKFNVLNNILTQILHDNICFIESLHSLTEKRNAKLAEFNKNNDNMFSAVFKFKLENFHSEILRRILDPATPETGDERFLNLFVDTLIKINPNVKRHNFTANVHVECEASGSREEGRIDIYIYDDDYAVIIENKINQAQDQPNQLAKYLKAAKAQKKEVIAVVYIPKFEDCEPPLDSYDEPYKEFVPEINEKLVVLPAINRRNGKNDIANGFITQCVNLTDINSPQNYMLSQYAKLLKTIEGDSKMTESIDREFIEEFYKDKKNIGRAECIASVWENREALLGGILRKPLWDKLKSELSFYEPEAYTLYFDISDKLRLVFYSEPDTPEMHIGFLIDENFIDKNHKDNKLVLNEKLNDILRGPYFIDSKWDAEYKNWFTKKFCYGEYKDTLDEIQNYFLNHCKALADAAKALKL